VTGKICQKKQFDSVPETIRFYTIRFTAAKRLNYDSSNQTIIILILLVCRKIQMMPRICKNKNATRNKLEMAYKLGGELPIANNQ